MLTVAERCINWMNSVIECHKELYDEGDEMHEIDKKAIEDAEYIIMCIKEMDKRFDDDENMYDHE